MEIYDVAVIGGGVVGGMILRELTKYNLDVVLLEKNCDVAMGQSKANSGIVHAGFDAETGTNKAKFNVLGANMMESICLELGVKYKKIPSLVIAFNEDDLNTLITLKKRGELNGVEGLSIISKEELKSIEPNISDNAKAALRAESAGIVSPYNLTIAAIGNAMDNGAELMLNFDTFNVSIGCESVQLKAKDGRMVEAKLVINAAGFGAENIANLFCDDSFKIGVRRGEYMLLDRECGDLVNSTLFFTPSEKGKGVLVAKTVDGNILLGPTSVEDGNPLTVTSEEGFSFIREQTGLMCKNIPYNSVITSFAGNRVFCDRHDFVIEGSDVCDKLINLAGIESPGLTSSPAIAKYVVEELVSKKLKLEENACFQGCRERGDFFNDLTDEQKNELIKKDKSYGKVVCRCEVVTEGEIRRVVKQNPKPTTVDGVKLRTRAGMGRCQGGFCQSRIVEILAEENKVSILDVTKNGEGSEVLLGVCK